MRRAAILGVCGLVLVASEPAVAQDTDMPMTFFLTSEGPGDGANLGGLVGADAHCQMLATDAGAGDRTWRAYLSTQGPNAVNARDRVGTGPWHNAHGVVIGNNLDELHGDHHRLTFMIVLDERGRLIPGGGFFPNRHDILTGTAPDGMAFPEGEDMTCRNWTSNNEGKARMGHHDRTDWFSAHDSRGCSPEQLRITNSDGLFYCFAVD